MKAKAMFILTVLILLPSIAFSSLTGEIRLSLVEGDVQVRPGDTEEWFPASINTPVLEGDRLWVPDRGRLEMQLRDGSILRLNENTSLDVLRMEDGSLQFYINSGSLYINFTGRKRYLQIDAPGASIRVYERSKFRVDVSENGRIDVSTYSGNVYVESGRGRSSVRAGNMLSIRDEEYAELSPLGPSDEWERWNRERDRRLTERRYSYRYLPDE
ncbi:MAG: FecR domain-containing protein, partial [Thermodesulfovibrionales bacterium]